MNGLGRFQSCVMRGSGRRHGEGDGDGVGDLWMSKEQEVWSKRFSAQMKVKVCEWVGAISEG